MAEINLLAEIIKKEAQAIDYNNVHIQEIANGIAKEAVTLSEEEFYQITLNAILSNSNFYKIKIKIKEFLNKLKIYGLPVKGGGSLEERINNLQRQKEFIYKDFFELQNLINEFLGQTIQMTYVHIDDEGKREIRISNNDIQHLEVKRITPEWAENFNTEMKEKYSYAKLTYTVEDHYKKLKNALPEEDNNELQETAKEVDRRYTEHKHKVLWLWPSTPKTWKGYKLSTKGPINEAFVNMYVHNIKLLYSLEGNIDTFMLDTSYGAIKADATKGFLLGDISDGITQYAVKGIFGAPQKTNEVIEQFKKMEENSFSPESFANFIKYFTYDELHRNYKPQIKELSSRSLANSIRYMEKEIIS